MNSSPQVFDTVVVVGRFQIAHLGHLDLLQNAAKLAHNLVVVIGSAHQARDPRNPFNWRERVEMLQALMGPELVSRTSFCAIKDRYDNELWAADVTQCVRAAQPQAKKIAIVGHRKDATSDYIDLFPDWAKVEVPSVRAIDATALRDLYFGPGMFENEPKVRYQIRQAVTAEVWTWLERWRYHNPAIYLDRVDEHHAVRAYKKRWTGPKYFTSDAMVVCQGHVLMVQRGGVIGRGLWALPGGFRDPGEDALTAALRELEEETGLVIGRDEALQRLRGSEVFNHPLRSPRGHLETEAFFIDLDADTLPNVIPAVDKNGHQEAMAVKWIPLAEIPQMSEQIFEDHSRILEKGGASLLQIAA